MTLRIDKHSTNNKSVSIYTGNTCNLACVLCGPESSSKWRSELGLGKDPTLGINIDDVNFDNIEYITFGGGEPLLNKSTLLILQKIDSNANVSIHLNGTVLPDQRFLDECVRFTNIKFSFSIDDVEEQFEFLRWPAKWDEVVNNMLWLRENCPDNIKFSFNTVVSQLNQHSYNRVADWVNCNFPTNKAGVATELHINESNGMLNRLQTENCNESVDFLDSLDQRRGTNWRKVFAIYKS